MRIPSGVADQYLYFVAVDPTDLKTRETGLSSFTVYRSRNGGAAAAYTTPTINETDGSNMPGVYELLLDEDMTIDTGDKSQEVVLHITHASMAPVTRVFELYRPDVTAGETLTVSSGTANAAVQSIANNAITAASIATGAIDADAIADGAIDAGAFASDAITAAKVASDVSAEIADAVWDELLSGHAGVGSAGAGLQAAGSAGDPWSTALPGAYGVGSAGAIVGNFPGDIGGDLSAIKTKTDQLTFTTASRVDSQVYGMQADVITASAIATDAIASAELAATAVAEIADAVWDEARSGHVNAGTFGEYAPANVSHFGGSAGSFSGGRPEVNTTHAAGTAWNSGAITANAFASGAITSAKFAANALDAVWSASTRLLTAGTNIALAKGTGVTGFNDLSASDMRTAVGLSTANLDTQLAAIASYIDTEVAAIKAKTDGLPSDPADASVIAAAFTGVNNALTALDALIDAVKAKTDLIPATPAATGDVPSAVQNADALLDRSGAVETGLTPRQTLRLVAALLGGKVSGAGTGTETFRNAISDSKDRLTVTVDGHGNRSAVVVDLT